jgi:micrococcal nuclease
VMEPAYGPYRAEVLRVVDADTLELRVDLGFRVATVIEARIRGVDAPEKNTKAGTEAIVWARYILNEFYGGSEDVLVKSYRDRMSFARWVVDVWLPDGRSYADMLLEAGHAVPMAR